MTRNPTLFFIFLLACAATIALYSLGLPGSFIFDDYPNLELLGHHGGVHDLKTLKFYLNESFAGPTGRPIAMLSFLLNAQDWPASPLPFKLSNILLHVINGLLLFWVLLLALPQTKLELQRRQIGWIAAIAAAWWMLTPYHVSTVLYVVQRMTMLSTSFILVGIAIYLIGRRRLQSSSRAGLLILSIGIPAATLAATLSKENGTLLPLLLLVLEFTLFSRASDSRPQRWWLSLFLGMPTIAILTYLLSQLATLEQSLLDFRGFTHLQRLLTESRLLLDYLWQLLVPHIETKGLFQDDITLSRTILEPISTLFSLLTITGLITATWLLRRRMPLLSAAIGFFLAGHLLESTLLPLELAFEHRNYLPSLLLYLPPAWLLIYTYQRSQVASILVGLLCFAVLSTTLAARTELWSDRLTLYHTWAVNNPGSARAQIAYANALDSQQRPDLALQHLNLAIQRSPESLLLRLHQLRLQARRTPPLSSAPLAALVPIQRRIETAAFSHESILALMAMTDDRLAGNSRLSSGQLLSLWQAFSANPNTALQHTMGAQIHHQQGRLLLAAGHSADAIRQFRLALLLSQSKEAGLKQAALLASHGHFCAALRHLRATRTLTRDSADSQTQHDYQQQEIDRLTRLIRTDARQSGQHCEPSASALPLPEPLPETAQ